MPLSANLVAIASVVVACLGALVLPLYVRWRRAKRHPPGEPPGRRCVCGYLLVGLEIPRCPECGRMIGFDKSPADIGVSEQEMRAEAERRRTTRGSATIP
jgi:hypothetical protein